MPQFIIIDANMRGSSTCGRKPSSMRCSLHRERERERVLVHGGIMMPGTLIKLGKGQLESSSVSQPINLIDDVDISDLKPAQRAKTPGTMCPRYPTSGPETRE